MPDALLASRVSVNSEGRERERSVCVLLTAVVYFVGENFIKGGRRSLRAHERRGRRVCDCWVCARKKK